MNNQIDNTQDVIDSREIIDRIEELEGIEEPNAEEAQELAILLKVQEQAEPYAADWQYGETLIRDSYFTDYIKELIADCYELPKEFESGAWPWRHMTLDYEAAADEAKDDYTWIEFDGVTYLIRS